MQTVSTRKITEELNSFPIHHCLETLSYSAIQTMPACIWLQSTLPICLGGLGLQETLGSSLAAFMGSYNLTHGLTSKLLLDSNLSFSRVGLIPLALEISSCPN